MKVFFRQVGALVRLSLLELWRRNDIFGLLVLALALLAPLALAHPFDVGTASRYQDEAALLLLWAFSFFIALGTGARLFPPEFENRTIYPLLAKPVARGRLLLGKYLGAVVATDSALALFYALFGGAVALRGGTVLTAEFAQGFVLHLAFAALAVAVSLFGSLLVTRSANLTLSALGLGAMFFFGRRLPEYAECLSAPLAGLLKAVYAVAPHAEFFDMRQRIIHGWGAVDGWVFAAVLGYAVLYVAVLLALSTVLLKRKRA